MTASPRVTLGVATYSRDTYLAEAVASCLAQDYADLEVLVVVDGSVNPRIDAVLATFDDPRLRVVRHPENRGIAEAYNTIVREGRGELIAMLGDDDVCLPDRISRSVAVFDAHPETAIVHGDAQVIDADGTGRGLWRSGDFAPGALLQHLWRIHNPLIDPTRLVHRRVYAQVGGYHADFRTSQDFHFFVRAADAGLRFRHVAGAPLIRLRRHDDNLSGDDQLARQVEEVERTLLESLDRHDLATLVPELDWAVIDRAAGEKRALEMLAAAVERRGLPLPGLARRLRRRAEAVVVAPRGARNGRKLVMTSFGFNDSGGGTAVPRVLAKELVRRGWDVTVFYAAVEADPSGVPYALSRREEDGVTLVGVHNRAHAGLLAVGDPGADLDDPPITAAFAALLDEVRPDVVHFHNLHNLGAELLELPARRGIPSIFSPHNHWLVCPRAYLLRPDGALCDGPGDGARCAACVGSTDVAGHVERLDGIRRRFARSVDVCLAMSEAIRASLVDAGYPAEAIDLLPQSMPAVDTIWDRVGRDRVGGRRAAGAPLRVGFFGSVYGLKGPQVLVAAAQQAQADLRVVIHGDVPDAMARQLRALDRRGVVEIHGRFTPTELPDLLASVDVAVAPSLVWETQGLAALEARAARVPVVAARMGGLAEAVRHDVDGLLFDGGDAAGLAAALDRLATEDGLLERLQAAIPQPPSFATFVDALEAVYAGERGGRVARPRAADHPVAVRWRGDHGLATSLSTINREVTARLDGDPCIAVGCAERTGAGGAGFAPLPHLADVEVRHEWPPDFTPPASGRLVLIQPWEFGTAPRDWVAPLRDEVDELWVPSEHVRGMYLAAGVPGERVKVIANGVDLVNYSPAGPALDLGTERKPLRLLFVGGAIARKGVDVLLEAYISTFAGRDDVELVIKDFGRDGVYRGSDRSTLDALAAPGALPKVTLIDRELSGADMAALYRACDVLVHPYRGEGFAMPVLEAMACGLPVLVTAGGPTDEFVPDDAGWKLRATRKPLAVDAIAGLPLAAEGWMLEPDVAHLRALLAEVAGAGTAALAARGAAAARAAQRLSWDAVSAAYAERLHAVAARPPRTHRAPELAPILDEAGPRVLALPAWRADADDLPALLAAWAQAAPPGAPGTLILVADAERDGAPEAVEARILTAAAQAGVDLERCADIAVRFLYDQPGGDAALHADADAFVPLHAASAGHARMARAAGNAVLAPDAGALRGFLAGAGAPALSAAGS
ncbi:glycosyltransferase [Baekduia alba]|uniref:glycosyltransferase n=1 Tax=Baekduia alba TaxID=2997333 RepID=UPI002340DDF4|nr:glycosyltransferase [Baekduia alba]